jgi:hypothetical protein
MKKYPRYRDHQLVEVADVGAVKELDTAADARGLKAREQGRVVNVHALIAVGVNAEVHREILGIDVSTAEDGAGWLTFWRSLTARGLSGVRLVTSDVHAGLVAGLSHPARDVLAALLCPLRDQPDFG